MLLMLLPSSVFYAIDCCKKSFDTTILKLYPCFTIRIKSLTNRYFNKQRKGKMTKLRSATNSFYQ